MRRLLLILACVSIAAPAYAKHKKVVKKPKPVKLATRQVDPDGVVADQNSLYWMTGDHAIHAVPIGGGKVQTLVDASQSVSTFTVYEREIDWIDFDGNVKTRPLDGGDATTVATGQKGAQGITNDGGSVCWSIYGEKGSVACVAVAGGNVRAISPNESWPGPPIVVGGTMALWALNDGTIRAAPADGTDQPIVVATAGTHPGGLVTDEKGANVYWTVGNDDGQIMNSAYGGGQPKVIADHQPTPMFIALDASNLYWVNMGHDTSTERGDDGNDGTVMELPLAGGTPKTLAAKLGAPSGLAQDATDLYVSDQRTGIIWSIAK